MPKKNFERDYPGFDPSELERSGPYNIIWNTDTPTSHTRLNQREIWIRKEDISRPDVLAHEIAHSRLLRGDQLEMVGSTSEEELSSWQELEAVLYTIAKDQFSNPGILLIVLHDISDTFSDGSLVEAKKIAQRVLSRMKSRGHITESERSKAASKVNRVSRSKFESI